MRKSKWLWLVVGLVGIGGLAVAVWLIAPSNARDNQDPARQAEIVKIALEWGRFAPFPANANKLTVQTEGNSFTRSVRVSFAASEKDIKEWMVQSPGISEATLQTLSDGRLKYNIVPGGGANYAEAIIDFTRNTVEIYVSWG